MSMLKNVIFLIFFVFKLYLSPIVCNFGELYYISPLFEDAG